MPSIISILLFALLLVNVYVCHKCEITLASLNVHFSILFFRLAYFAVFMSFLASIYYQGVLLKYEIVNTITSVLLGIYLCMFMTSLILFAFFDAAFLISRILPGHWGVRQLLSMLYASGFSVLIISLLVSVYGLWNAQRIVLKEYDVTINKVANVRGVRIAVISDVHLGTSIKEKQLADIVYMVNELSPDLVCITGDLFDHGTTEGQVAFAHSELSKLNSRLGTYFVFGNHERYLSDLTTIAAGLRASGVKTLADEVVLMEEDGFYLVGRKDHSYTGRKNTDSLIAELDKNKPIILLDHQPNDIYSAVGSGVSLQISGHTHSGQVFPFNVLVRLFNGLFYGYYRIGDYQAIVTSGAGVWRFPIRTSNKNEIALVNVHFDAAE